MEWCPPPSTVAVITTFVQVKRHIQCPIAPAATRNANSKCLRRVGRLARLTPTYHSGQSRPGPVGQCAIKQNRKLTSICQSAQYLSTIADFRTYLLLHSLLFYNKIVFIFIIKPRTNAELRFIKDRQSPNYPLNLNLPPKA